jgi:putative PIN family toxin of toxin-antitoxin system
VKTILDTNVFKSGIFFGGPPYQILDSWRNGKVDIVLLEAIFAEYQHVANELSKQFKDVDISVFLDLIAVNATWVEAPELPFSVSSDPDDDKFISCALASKSKIIVSGDKHLLAVSGYRRIEVVKPRVFIERYLKNKKRSQMDAFECRPIESKRLGLDFCLS